MAAAHGTLDLRNASQKNCSGEWTTRPQTFFNISFNAGKASELPDSFLQENFDLEGCENQNLVKTVYLKIFLFIPHINLKSGYTAFFFLHIFI